MYGPVPGLWDEVRLKARVRDVAAGSWRGGKLRSIVIGSHAATTALEGALFAFDAGHDPRQCIEIAANQGANAPAVMPIVGQLAGAHYGASALPGEWLNGLARRAEIEAMADALHDKATA